MTIPGKVIHLISGPRNLSTALMYAFRQRNDTDVLDEPFYGHYLRVSGACHPGREAILASQPMPVEAVVAGFFAERTHPHLFIKGMAHHLRDMDLGFLGEMDNVLLIRDPQPMIASFAQVIHQPTAEDIGLPKALALFEQIRTQTGRTPLVLDSGDLLADPPGVLRVLCEALGISWNANMLHWPAGGIPEDGVWAPYWYANVHRSTGFARQPTSSRPLPEDCRALYEEVLPIYRTLSTYALKA